MKKRLVIFFLAAAMVLGGCENKNSKLYKKGIEALEQKDYVTSIAMLEGAVKAGDRLAESYRSLGIAYLKSQEYDKAKEAFKSSLSSMKHKDAEFSRDVMYYEAETCVQIWMEPLRSAPIFRKKRPMPMRCSLGDARTSCRRITSRRRWILMRQWRRRRAISSALTFTSCIRRAA